MEPALDLNAEASRLGRPIELCKKGFCPKGLGNTPVLVMKAANVWEGEDFSAVLSGDAARLWTLLFQREMGARRLVVIEVGAQEPFEMAIIVDDNVIETLLSLAKTSYGRK